MDWLKFETPLCDLTRHLVYEIVEASVFVWYAPCVFLAGRGIAPFVVRLLHDGAIYREAPAIRLHSDRVTSLVAVRAFACATSPVVVAIFVG